jgi:hypothetical protein
VWPSYTKPMRYIGSIFLVAAFIVLAGRALAGWLPATAPTESSQVSPTELKYRLIEQFGQPFYCDPDLYPVGREVPMGEVRQRVLNLSANDPTMFQVIAAHLGIADPSSLSDDQVRQMYDESKKLNGILLDLVESGYQFQIRISDAGSQGRLIAGLISRDGDIEQVRIEPATLICPRCLPGSALIDTPDGLIPVKDLRKGMQVWTSDGHGGRYPAIILDTVVRWVPLQHEMMHVVLDDGRQLYVAGGHPLADGRAVGSLSKGDVVDGAHVIEAKLVRQQDDATYDILPSGETGTYWANSILLGSTLYTSISQR